MPAPTVRLVASSMRMKPPVVRLRRYSSAQQRHGGAQPDPADLVERQLGRRLVAVQRVDVEPVLQVRDDRPGVRVVCLIAYLRAEPQRRRLVHPADHRLDVLRRRRARCAGGRSCRRGRCRSRRPAGRSPTSAGTPRRPGRRRCRCRRSRLVKPGRQHHHLVAGLEHAARRPGRRSRGSRVRASTAAGSRTAPGTARRPGCGREAMCTCSRWCSSAGPVVPGHVGRPGDDVVAVQRRDRDDGQVGRVELGGERGELVARSARRPPRT